MEQHSTSNHENVVKGSEVFVGGLARTTSENKIHEEFSSCGEIAEIRLIKDQKGNSKGYCFVRFSTKRAADKAVKEKSGSVFDGKKIGVLPSADQDTLYFGNLPKDWSSDEFVKIMRQVFPDVVSVDLPKPSSNGDTLPSPKQQNRGFAFVKFSSHAAAARAYRAGCKSDFSIAVNCHPAVEWAKDEPEIDPEELAKVKIAFVRNLPADSDENYLKKLFEPLGKLEKVVLSRKGRNTVGFIHFANRSDLDNAVKGMSGKTVQGPNGGPSIMLTVEVARPVDKNKKRAHSDTQNKTVGKIGNQSKALMDDKNKAQKVKYSTEEAVVTDAYEAAVVSLPMVVKERLLRILRLGIATRFDINIQYLTSLKELPESMAISVLDQFMLSGADRLNKGVYLSELISRHRVDRVAVDRLTFSQRRVGGGDIALSTLSSLSSRVPPPASANHHPLASSRLTSNLSRYEDYTSRYTSSSSSSLLSDYRLPRQQIDFGKLEEAGPTRLLHQTPYSSSSLVDKFGLRYQHTAAEADNQPTTRMTQVRFEAENQPTTRRTQVRFEAENQPTTRRTQVRFDPFTGKPYKFDPFTGEPIQPESSSRGGPY